MRYSPCLILFSALFAEQQAAFANETPLSIAITCRSNPTCVFKGDDIYLDIEIYNQSEKNVFLTTKFMRGTGADIKIIDTRTRTIHYSFAGLGDYTLLRDYELIPAKGKVVMKSEVITGYDLTVARKSLVHLQLEVNFSGRWKYSEGNAAPFKETGYVDIVGEDTIAQRYQRK